MPLWGGRMGLATVRFNRGRFTFRHVRQLDAVAVPAVGDHVRTGLDAVGDERVQAPRGRIRQRRGPRAAA